MVERKRAGTREVMAERKGHRSRGEGEGQDSGMLGEFNSSSRVGLICATLVLPSSDTRSVAELETLTSIVQAAGVLLLLAPPHRPKACYSSVLVVGVVGRNQNLLWAMRRKGELKGYI